MKNKKMRQIIYPERYWGKIALTCKSWFRISGPTNWERSLPIYKLDNKSITILEIDKSN